MFPVWPSQDRPCSCRACPPGATRCLQSVCKGGIRCKEDRNLRMPKLTWSDPKSFQILKWFIFVKRNAHKWNWVQACALRGKIETIIWNSNAVLQGIDGWSCEKPWWTNDEPMLNLHSPCHDIQPRLSWRPLWDLQTWRPAKSWPGSCSGSWHSI